MSAPPPPGPVWPSSEPPQPGPPQPPAAPPPGWTWSPSGSPQPPAGPPPAGGPQGYYPQQPYYAPGWTTPAATPPRRRGGRLALALVAGVLALVVVGGAAVGVVHWQRTRPIGDVTTPRTATARQVTTGHCIAELPDDGEVASVHLVPCADEHEAEVVGVLGLRTDSWPGQDVVDGEVARWCEMDTWQAENGFRAVVWTPSRTAWGQGDRRGVCLAWYDGGGVTGSFRNGDVAIP